MGTLTEGRHPGESLISESNGDRSREAVIFASGAAITPGMVLGKVTGTGKYVPLAPAAVDGSEAAAGIAYGAYDAAAADADGVAYVRDCEHADVMVTFPDGISAPDRATAVTELAALGIILR